MRSEDCNYECVSVLFDLSVCLFVFVICLYVFMLVCLTLSICSAVLVLLFSLYLTLSLLAYQFSVSIYLFTLRKSKQNDTILEPKIKTNSKFHKFRRNLMHAVLFTYLILVTF